MILLTVIPLFGFHCTSDVKFLVSAQMWVFVSVLKIFNQLFNWIIKPKTENVFLFFFSIRQKDKQTNRQTYGQTDRRTDILAETLVENESQNWKIC
jgi:hypothetical protein